MRLSRVFILVILFVVAASRSAYPTTEYWSEEGLPLSTLPATAFDPEAVTDGEGGAIIVWRQDGIVGTQGVFVQHVDAQANLLWTAGGVQLSIYPPADVTPRIVATASGWLVAWADDRSGETSIYAAFVQENLTPPPVMNGTKVQGSEGMTNEMQMIPVDVDEAIIVWKEGSAPAEAIYGQRIDESIASLWDLAGVPIGTSDENRNPQLVPHGTEGAMVVWEYSAGGNPWITVARALNGIDGSAAWPAGTITAISPGGSDPNLVAVSDDNGGALAAMVGLGGEVRIQRIEPDGSTSWNGTVGEYVFPVGYVHVEPQIVLDGSVNAVVAVVRGEIGEQVVMARRLNLNDPSDTSPPYWEVAASSMLSEISHLRLATSENGGALASWHILSGTPVLTPGAYVQSLDAGSGAWYWPEEVQIGESCNGCTFEGPAVVGEMMGGSYMAWTSQGVGPPIEDGVRVSRVTRTENFQIEKHFRSSRYLGNFHWWDVSVSFDVASGNSVEARVYHNPYGCDQICDYHRVEYAPSSSSHNIPLYASGPGDPLDPVSVYCYRVIPGGVPLYEGTISLQPVDGTQPNRTLPLHIDGEDAFIDTTISGCAYDETTTCYTLYDNGVTYAGVLSGEPQLMRFPKLVTKQRRMGAHSILFHTPPVTNPDPEQRQRTEFRYVNDVPFYETRYTSFSVMVDSTSEIPPGGGGFISQWWGGYGYAPPLGLQLVGNPLAETFDLELHVLFDSPEESQCVGYALVASVPVVVNEWMDFIVGFRFDPYGECGYAELWLNGQSVSDENNPYYGELGYPEPFNPCSCIAPPETCTQIRQFIRTHRFGTYRFQQEENLRIWFDEVKHGTKLPDVLISPVKITNDNVTTQYIYSTGTFNATVTFETNQDVLATVRYDAGGLDCAFGQSEPESGSPSQTHAVLLSGLAPSTQHCYRIEVASPGYPLLYIDGTFITPVAPPPCAKCPNPGETSAPEATKVIAITPNPFNPTTEIRYSLRERMSPSFSIYDVRGRLVRLATMDDLDPGIHEWIWDGRNDRGDRVGTGVYFITFSAGDFVETRKAVLLK